MHKFTAVLVRLVVRASGVGDHAGRAFGHPGCTVCNKTLDSFSCFWCLSHKFVILESSEWNLCGWILVYIAFSLVKNNFETIKHLTESWLMRGPWALPAGLRCAVLVGKYQITAFVL
jgi:hypothetical protein